MDTANIIRAYGTVARVSVLFHARNRSLQGSFRAAPFPVGVQPDAVSFLSTSLNRESSNSRDHPSQFS